MTWTARVRGSNISFGGEAVVTAESGQSEADDLLLLALSCPREALARAHAILARQPGAYEASIAHQAAGIVLRDIGDISAGVRELRTALRLARRAGLAERGADVLEALGIPFVDRGRAGEGVA